ncbi:MAG: YceI family protein [Ignavibacteriales bacterium]|nr:YceI family protein [Ignavibacteriales bacterium]
MKRFFLFSMVLTIPLVALFAQAPAPQSTGWRLDKAHSRIYFTIKHMVVAEVLGYFKDFDVTFNATKDDYTDGQVEAVIKVATINTDNENRDKDLRSSNFFSADSFPEIRFKSTKFEKLGDNSYKIHGSLTVRDVTKDVVFDAAYNGMIKTSRGFVSAWKATLAINRFDYGLKWNSMIETGGLVAGETVNITVVLELRKPLS